MVVTTLKPLAIVAALAAIGAASTCPKASSTGESTGETWNVSDVSIYVASPPNGLSNSSKAIVFVTDIFGVQDLQNRLLADSIARANYTVYMPDLFDGDPVTKDANGSPAGNLTEWNLRHPTSDIDRHLNTTVTYLRNELGVQRLGGTGYCFGGRHVPRWLADGKGLDVGFIAHPSNLQPSEIQAIAGPISIAAGGLDDAFNVTARRTAEDILTAKGLIYQTSFYTGARHGFAVNANASDPQQVYAKTASFLQAVTWFDSWL